MNCRLTIFVVFFSVFGGGIQEALDSEQPVRTYLVRTVPPLLSHMPSTGFPSAQALMGTPLDRTSTTGRGFPVLVGQVQGVDSPETGGMPRPVRLPKGINIFLVAAVFAMVVIAVLLYIGQLVVLGWIVDVLSEIEDFLSQLGMPRIRPRPDPLEYEQVGEIIVVTLRNNIATLRQCQSVQKQLKRLTDEHHCDFVVDFSFADRISRSFRAVMFHFLKAVRKEARRLGNPGRPVAVPRGKVFRVFEDRQRALEEMSKHDGHGWVVLCAVPVGIRAVSDLT
jgi:hypothetical protein